MLPKKGDVVLENARSAIERVSLLLTDIDNNGYVMCLTHDSVCKSTRVTCCKMLRQKLDEAGDVVGFLMYAADELLSVTGEE